VIRAGTLSWFARHELRLAWREWLALVTGGRKRRRWGVAAGLAAFAAFAHAMAWVVVGNNAPSTAPLMTTLIMITAAGLLLLPVMVSQAMETVTRAFYTRADLDLILSSPVAAVRLFAVRIAAMAASVTLTAILISAPLIDVLAIRGGAGWLAAYGGVAAIGMVATSFAVAFVVALFRLIGPGRTRLVAQIVAAVIGAVFVIGIQIAAIMSYGTTRRPTTMLSDAVSRHAPAQDSLLWWPARAALGDPPAFAAVIAVALLVLGAAITAFAPGFARRATLASGMARDTVRRNRRSAAFRARSPARTLRHKEWALLLRDPWLVSQSLMQLLYLVVPAVILWRSAGGNLDAGTLIVPVLIMTAGQLSGGLTWVTISGEDAPDLIASAPVSARAVLRAKLEAVLGCVAIVFAPLVAGFALLAPLHALVSLAGIGIATASAATIQLWFRAQAKRSNFRRRQTSSRLATFAEAISTITWAASGAMAAMGNWFAAIGMGVFVVLILAGVRALSPARGHAA
jgi:ABC-2 type transport system permease protein